MRTNGADVSIAEENRALENVALDYFEGWFDGDAGRMERALHPDLAKRHFDPAERSLTSLTADQMIRWTAEGNGRARDVPERAIEISIEHVHGPIANVTAKSAVYIDYLQVLRTQSGWKIVNVLWDWASEEARGRAQ